MHVMMLDKGSTLECIKRLRAFILLRIVLISLGILCPVLDSNFKKDRVQERGAIGEKAEE